MVWFSGRMGANLSNPNAPAHSTGRRLRRSSTASTPALCVHRWCISLLLARNCLDGEPLVRQLCGVKPPHVPRDGRQQLTHSVISQLSIDAVRKVHSLWILGVPSQLQSLSGQEHGRTIPLDAGRRPMDGRLLSRVIIEPQRLGGFHVKFTPMQGGLIREGDMKKILLTGAALATLIGTPALAADMAVKAPPMPAPVP